MRLTSVKNIRKGLRSRIRNCVFGVYFLHAEHTRGLVLAAGANRLRRRTLGGLLRGVRAIRGGRRGR